MTIEKYEVYDLADGWADVLGRTSNMNTVKKIARERMDDTDGDCQIFYSIRKEDGKFDFQNRIFLDTI